MSKNVLILCTGNSCRSIIAEALINAELEGVTAYSSGVNASGKVNQHAKSVLQNADLWDDRYYSKTLDAVIDTHYDLIVTVCSNAEKDCPTFPKVIKTIHVGFADPDGKGFEAFEETLHEIHEVLLPKIVKAL